jgi:hypothetical protein
MTRMQLVRTLAAWRPDLTDFRNVASAYRITLKSLGRRYLELHDEIADLDVMIGAIVDELAPDLVARNSIGHGAAAQLLLTAGDNSERLQSEASFAALCGVSPIPASSGKTIRHRLNRGGDRAANSALHIIVGFGPIREPKPTWPSGPPRAIPNLRSSASSNVTSPVLLDHAATAGDQPSPSRCLINRRASRGSQYAAEAYQKQLAAIDAKPSMRRKGFCYDNAPMESFFHTLKVELVHQRQWTTREEVKRDLFAYIEAYYNRARIHSELRYRTPEQAERLVS